ncbi:hypothetical protein ILYODFUR_002767 [Ilyodon furcidens]|uniref:Secreted protein n=1 Tax=Ilyodon furcidens TaxID=33524 RepID=A0ABV0UNU8_9TELE
MLTSRYSKCAVMCLLGYFFRGALKEAIKTSLFYLLQPQNSLLLRRWFPFQSLHARLSLPTPITAVPQEKRFSEFSCWPRMTFRGLLKIGHTMLDVFSSFFSTTHINTNRVPRKSVDSP